MNKKAIKTGGISRDTDSGFIDGYGGGIEVVGGFIEKTGFVTGLGDG